MEVYCTEKFIAAFIKLQKKKSYRDLGTHITEYFSEKEFTEVATGDRIYDLGKSKRFLKKRIPDAAGYRIYFLADFKTQCIYIHFCHPKTGDLGYNNITVHQKKELLKTIIQEIKIPGNLFQFRLSGKRKMALEFYKPTLVSNKQ